MVYSVRRNFVLLIEFNKPVLDHYRHFRYSGFIKILTLLLIAGGLLNAQAISLPDGPEVGQLAPPLKLSTWLQAPPEAALGWPAGKVVVLEFWSTTCGSCVANIPHLNELAEKFKGQPVQFIAVTDDPESVVQRFLKKTPINAWIGLGPDAGFGEDTPYRVWAIPHTVIIDTHSRIAAITSPFVLSVAMIQACLDGTLGAPVGEQTTPTNQVFAVAENSTSDGGQIPGFIPGQYMIGIRPIFQVMIRPAPTNRTSLPPRVETWIYGQALTLQNDPLSRAIEVAFAAKPTRIVNETKLPKEKYDFYITLPPINGHPETQAAFESVFAQAVAATFGLTVKRETRDIDVLVLRTNATSLDRLSKSTNPDRKYSAFWNESAATNQPLSALAEELEISSAMPVFDETGLTKPYDFDIKWEQPDCAHPNVAGMIVAVKQLGLDLVPVKKSLEVIVVSKSN